MAKEITMASKGSITRGSSKVALAAALTLPIGLAAAFAPLAAQDVNLLFAADSIESLLRTPELRIIGSAGTRFEGDRTQRVVLEFEDELRIKVKWAKAPSGGRGSFNNRPRYEIAAYELQKLFLDDPEYVVPPTVARCVPVDQQRQIQTWAEATFSGTNSVLVVLQYWLWNVTADDVWNKDRFKSDTLYARHFANLDLFTYLIRHSDSNEGNVLISSVTANPRVFAVDNGVAFNRREVSDRGTKWRGLRVHRLPQSTVDRLRALTRDEQDRRLAVLVQFRRAGEALIPTTPTAPLDRGKGVRSNDEVVQLGLTEHEIDQIWDRIQKVLEKVDEQKIALF
ncbi:MAG: hypothetical protein P8Y07_06370 [Gemmatimonadales bacterium]